MACSSYPTEAVSAREVRNRPFPAVTDSPALRYATPRWNDRESRIPKSGAQKLLLLITRLLGRLQLSTTPEGHRIARNAELIGTSSSKLLRSEERRVGK